MIRRDTSERAVGPIDLARKLEALAPGSVRRLTRVAAFSFAGGLVEAGMLVLLARIAVTAADGSDQLELVPDIGPSVGIGRAVLVALLLLTAKVVCGVIIARGTASLASHALSEVRLRLMRSFLAASWPVQAAERPGHLQELMTTHADRTTVMCQQLAIFVTTGLNVATLVLIAVVVDPLAALTIVLTGALLALCLRPLASAGRRISDQHATAGRRFAGAVSELVTTARELHVFGTGPGAFAKTAQLHHEQAREYQRSRFLLLLTPHLYQGAALLVLIAGIGLVSVTSSSSVTGIGAVVLLLLRAFGYGQQVQSSYQHLNDTVPFIDRIRRQRDLYLANPADVGRRPLTRIGQLRLDRVGYEYLPGHPVLREVTVTIEPGQAIGIVGPSGSGKSTLLQLLLRLRDPVDGHLVVDGTDARELDLAAWYERVAFVPQDPRLVEGSVAENIAFYRDISHEDIRSAAERAQLAEEIAALPRGYDEIIGPEDTSLSGGQQQRLTIARALAGRPDLLVLDEPTSALDLLSEARIQQTLRALHRKVTLVVVAHRLSTVAECDKVMVLSEGAVQAFAPHDELLSASQFYEDMLRLSLNVGGG
jgi:ABC-type multidrug transport system fused ATPase/permease subunit